MASIADRPTLHLKRSRSDLFRRACSPALAGASRNANARIMWRIDQALRALHRAGRRSVSIVDVGCGDGSLLRRAALRARALGFVAIEARGFDRSPAKVAAAREAAGAKPDPAIGFAYEVAEGAPPAPQDEADEPDLVLAADGLDANRLGVHGACVIRHGWW